MIAYHGQQAIKDIYVARVRAHRAADGIVQGYGYWKEGRGCAVGCTIHGGNREAYETELGIPRVIAYLEDRLFEGLPADIAKAWPERFLSAIHPGADLSGVWRRWAIWLLSDPEHGTMRLCNACGAEATRQVVSLYQREIDGDTVSADEWVRAREQARAAAPAYAYAAYAAWSAADAAYAYAHAAGNRHYLRMADKFIELLEAAP